MKSKFRIPALILALVMAFATIPGMALAAEEEGTEADKYAARVLQVDSISASRIAVSGAKYEIADADGNIIETVTTNASGAAELSTKLEEAEYTIKCITPPAGYAKEENGIKIRLSKSELTRVNGVDTFSFTVPMNAIHATITARDENGAAIAESGAIFTVYSSNGKLFETVSTNAQGVATLKKNIPYGTYTVKQTKAPVGYYLDRSAKTFKVDDSTIKKASNGTYTVNVDVEQPEIKARLVVIDEETKNVIKAKGMEFEVLDAEGNVFCKLTTERNGTAAFAEALPYGEYTIQPTKMAEGYWINDKAINFTVSESDVKALEEDSDPFVKGDHVFTYTFKATPIKGAISVTVNGKAVSSFEEKEKDGYKIVSPVYSDVILEGVELSAFAAEEISLNKDVKLEEGEEADSATSNAKGIAKLDDMYLGNYNVVLASVPSGYVFDKEFKVEVELKGGSQKKNVVTEKVEINLEQKSTEISLVSMAEKMNSDGKSVSFEMVATEGFVYGLFAGEDFEANNEEKSVLKADTMIDVATSDKDGKVVFSGIYPVGKLYVKQLKAPEMYAVNDAYRADFDSSNAEKAEDKSIVMTAETNPENEIAKGSVVVKNEDENGNVITGAEYAIFDADNKQVASGNIHSEGHSEGTSSSDSNPVGMSGSSSVSSGSSSVVWFEATLVPGKYVVRQTSPANGYAADNSEYAFEVVANETVEVVTKNEKTVYEFVNVDKDGNPQAGVEFTAYDENGNAVAIAVSDENGVVRFEGIEQGKYTIKQTSAADGYDISNDTINVEIGDDWDNKEDGKSEQKFSGKKSMTWLYVLLGCVGGAAVIGVIVSVFAGSKKKDKKVK